jgi:chromate reductase, NAD(P)H dehydrogenase (quinone)
MSTRILLVSGSTRDSSTNTAALRTAGMAGSGDVTAVMFGGLTELPAFTPDEDPERPHPAVRDLREQIAAADGVIFSTPEYAGALPGSFKNLIDWTVGSGEFYRKPVAWISVAAQGRGEAAYAELAKVMGYVDAKVVDECCARLPLLRTAVGPDGLVTDTAFRERLAEALRKFARHIDAPA